MTGAMTDLSVKIGDVVECNGAAWDVIEGEIFGLDGNVMCRNRSGRNRSGRLYMGLLPCDFLPRADGSVIARVAKEGA